MTSLFPFDEIRSQLSQPLTLVEYGLPQLSEIIALESMSVHAAAMNVWNRIVQFNLYPVDPMAIARYVEKNDPLVHRKISQMIRVKVFKDVYFARCKVEDPKLSYNIAGQLFLARVYPNDLQICDVLLSNPYRPIPPSQRAYSHQDYSGYGILGKLLARIEEYARSQSCNFVTLTAASIDQYHLFKRHGFMEEDNPIARMGLEMGVSIPMQKDIT